MEIKFDDYRMNPEVFFVEMMEDGKRWGFAGSRSGILFIDYCLELEDNMIELKARWSGFKVNLNGVHVGNISLGRPTILEIEETHFTDSKLLKGLWALSIFYYYKFNMTSHE